MTSKLMSYALTAILTISIGLLGKIGWDNHKFKSVNEALNKELMQSDLAKGRAETLFGEADTYIKELEKAIQNEIKDRDANVTRYGRLRARYRALVKKIQGTNTTTSTPGVIIEVPVELKFKQGLLYEALTDLSLAPVKELMGTYEDDRLRIISFVEPYPNEKRDVPFSFEYKLDLKLKGQMVETLTASGAINHYFTLKEVNKEGKEVGEFKLEEFTVVVEDLRKSGMRWWAPHIDIAAFVGSSTLGSLKYGGSLGVSFMGYGLSNNDLSWRFPRLSLDLSNSPGLGFTPVLYNIAGPIPLFSNLWIGPHISYGLNDKEWILSFLLGAVL